VQATNASADENNKVVHRTTGGRVEISLLKNEGLSSLQASAAPAGNAAPNANGAPMPQADQNQNAAPAPQAQPAPVPPAQNTQQNGQKPPVQQ
jgi:hypothetical protein